MSSEPGVALITGAGRGLGRAFALALAERGFKIAAVARTQAEINATAEAIVRNGGRAVAIAGDVTDRQAVERAVATTEAELGSITLLINNAGIYPPSDFNHVNYEDWATAFTVNSMAPFKMILALEINAYRSRP